MTNSTKFDKDQCVKRLTDSGCEFRIAGAFADECTDLDAVRRSETPDTKKFDRERCVKRLTEAGLALAAAEAVADTFADGHALLRGQRHARPPANAE